MSGRPSIHHAARARSTGASRSQALVDILLSGRTSPRRIKVIRVGVSVDFPFHVIDNHQQLLHLLLSLQVTQQLHNNTSITLSWMIWLAIWLASGGELGTGATPGPVMTGMV